MARTGQQHPDMSTGTKGMFDVLGSNDQVAFKAILRASPNPSDDAHLTFFGHPYFISAFELKDGKTLHLEETPSAQVAQALAQVGDVDSYCAQGTMTDDHLIICFGLANWTGRLLFIANDAFDGFLKSEWPDATVPPAERRMLRQLLIGQPPAQAAAADRVAYETKRTYVKMLCRRLNVSGQVELVGAVLGRLMIAINAAATDTTQNHEPDPLRFYKEKFLPSCARVLQLLDGQGETIKILDIGPQSGRPVLFAHPIILPFFSETLGARLTSLNLRVLAPLRSGIFEPQAKVMSSDDYIDRAIEGLALCKSLLVGQNAPVLGLSNGGYWAVRFAQKYPELVPKLFLASMTFQTPKDGSKLGKFLSDYSAMVAKRPALINLYVDFLLYRYKDPARFRMMNDKVFPPGTIDGEAMVWEFSQKGALEAYMHFYHGSPAHLKADFHPGFYVQAQDIANLPCNVHMLHGDENSRDEIATIRTLIAGAPNTQLTELPGAGQVLRGAHLDAVWDLIANSN